MQRKPSKRSVKAASRVVGCSSTYNKAKGNESSSRKSLLEDFKSRGMVLAYSSHNNHIYDFRCCMSDDQRDDNAAEPAVHEIEGIVRNIKQPNKRIVSTSHDHQRDEIDDSERSCSVAEVL